MRILLTRPKPDCDAMADALERHGHACLIAPLLDVTFAPVDSLDVADAAATIATSRNGIRAIDLHPQADALKRLPCFTVGPGSRDLAVSLEFADVTAGMGDAAALVPVVTSILRAPSGQVHYFAARDRRFDLAAALAENSISTNTIVAYETKAASRLPSAVCSALSGGDVDVVVLMSPRTAATYVSLVNTAELSQAARKPRYACLSQAVADQLSDLSPDHIAITDRPNAEEMLALIHRIAALSG